ncbi:cob(I)yrinic acid a,c-diamide adenosyltransferase [Candidatus Wolfebacteria bacterium]|nr:cob(I)yrinic acid a,c-diamide adenosyltransferase [Candidatus Wolfebacteria bacterium]
MILVMTGNGKGKTTAALGQAIRALGEGKKVLMVQFIKGPWISGEDKFISNLKSQKSKINFEIIKTGKGFVGILDDKLPIIEHKKVAVEGLKLASKEIKSKKWDLIILDEINNAVNLKLIKAADVLKIIKNLSEDTDIIMTGRDAPKSFIKIADIVTEMREIKHIYRKGALAKKGIEF